MIRNIALLLTISTILAATAGAAGFSQDLPLGVSQTAPDHLLVDGNEPGYTEIVLDAPKIRIDDRLLSLETYQEFSLPGETMLYREGYPSIPHVTRYYRIPNTGSVELEIGDHSYTLVDDVNVLPVQPEANRFSRAPVKAADVYGVNAWYPEQIAEVGEPRIMRDFRVVPVTLYPVQVNPVTGQARIYENINVDLIANDQPGINEKFSHKPISSAFVPVYRDLIVNLEESALDEVAYDPGDFLILCRDDANSQQWADTLATWKKRRGFNVVVEARASWSAISMRNFIQDAYNAPDSRLEFVTIIGDAESGTYYMPIHSSGINGQYDHYYSLIEGDDDLSDVAVGRISVQSSTDLATVMNKIMDYEREPYVQDPSWFNRAFLYAGTGSQISSNEIMMLWARNQFETLTGVDDVTVETHPGSVNNSLIGNQLSAGAGFFFWRGSVIGEMSNSSATTMSSSPRLPVVLTITCGTGDFDFGESITESWLRAGTPNQPKGGVCCVGTATTYTHVSQNNTFAGGLIYNICNLGVEHVGAAIVGAKYQLERTFLGGVDALHFMRWNNLMGDPSISMWTDEPVIMDCSYPGTVNVGARRVTVQALDASTDEPIADALVVLWKEDDDSYTRGFTDAGGFVEMPVEVNSTGDLLVTVTKRNHKPYLGTIACANSSMMTTYDNHVLDDDNSGGSSGNNDGNVNPGETIELDIRLKNHGASQTAQNISVTMQSDNPKVSVVDGTVSYSNIDPNGSAFGNSLFRIEVDPSMRHEETAKLTLAVSTSLGTMYSIFEIECEAGFAIWESNTITGGDGDSRLEPGETVNLAVTVRNIGGVNMENVTGELISRFSLFSVLEENASFGQIDIDGTANNIGSEFTVRANAGTYPGANARALLVLTYSSGSIDSVELNIPVGQASSGDPTGPDEFGYYAYDNTDTDNLGDPFPWIYDEPWMDIASIGTRLNSASNDPGEQHPNGETNSDLIALPFSFEFYGQTFNQITVCSNGWAAFGDQDELDMFRNYPIPGMQAPDAFLAPFWDDLRSQGGSRGVYYYHDTANSRFIIQWKTSGWYFGEQGNEQEFQVILLDPSGYATEDGSGIIVFQYGNIELLYGDSGDVPYETVGIQAPGGLIGLPYRYNNSGYPGASTLSNGRTITFTTEANIATGSLVGTVVDAENDQPLQDVEIFIDGEGLIASTNSNGEYSVPDMVTGTYTVRAVLPGYNDGVINEFVVEQDSLEVANFSLLHPEIALSTENIIVTVPDQSPDASFTITNDGNGPLNYSIDIAYAVNGESTENWDAVADFDASGETGDFQIHGCTFRGDSWYVSGSDAGGTPKIYRFDLDGNYLDSFDQPESPSDFGWQDIVNADGVLYGSGGPDIVGVNFQGEVVTTISGAPEANPKSAMTWDPVNDHFWVADYATDVFEMDRQGNVVNRFEVPNNLNIRGLAWNNDDPNGYKLYIFHRTELHFGTHISRLHPGSGLIEYVRELPSAEGERAGGCAITGDWNSALQVFAGIVQGAAGDRLSIRQLNVRDDWFSVSPRIASVAASGSRDVSIFFEPDGMRDDEYDLLLNITNNSADSEVLLPVQLRTLLTIPDAPTPVATPESYSLSQNYPNPFNSTTTFEFALERAGHTKLTIYNLLGQQVATLVDGVREAGVHSVNFDLNLAASGVYLYRLESGDFSAARKLVYIK